MKVLIGCNQISFDLNYESAIQLCFWENNDACII